MTSRQGAVIIPLAKCIKETGPVPNAAPLLPSFLLNQILPVLISFSAVTAIAKEGKAADRASNSMQKNALLND